MSELRAMRGIGRPFVFTAIGLIVATGLIHFIEAPDAFREMPYKGVLFVANGVGALFSALGIYRGARNWGWLLGLIVAGGALLGYIASRTVGMPGLPAEPDAWLEPIGVASVIVEALFVILAFRVLMTSFNSRT